MEELLRLNDEVEKGYEKIPKEVLEKGIDSPLLDEYNIALDKFITLGRKIYNDNNLSYDALQKRVLECAINAVKDILEKKPQEALDKLVASPRTTQKVMEKLEYAIADSSQDKDFLSQFSSEQIASLKALQEYIRSIF